MYMRRNRKGKASVLAAFKHIMLEKRLQSISQHADICRSGTFQCLKNAWEDMGTNFPALHNRFDLGCERCDLSRAKTIILSNDLAKTIGRVIGGLCIASTRFRIENVGGHRFIVEIMPDCQCLKFREQRWANVIRRQSVSKVQCEQGGSLLSELNCHALPRRGFSAAA